MQSGPPEPDAALSEATLNPGTEAGPTTPICKEQRAPAADTTRDTPKQL